ncbi:MAG: class I SAM-dependent methyltransferase family protein [Candidatus Aenigmarchaeota archaeon]|nr:class I SAM-dependent methyltransferase family protein [Candidatus Aenigmarchaeota archaeon]
MRPLARILQGKMTEEQLELVPRSYDVVGSKEKSVAIIEVSEELDKKKKVIAKALMKLNRNVKSVLNKTSGRKGAYRLSDMELVGGNKDTEVLHKEYGYSLKLNPRKVYFSPREMTERERIASQVKPNETVVVFFSGVSPYAVAIAKKQPSINKIYSIEINPDAHKYAEENVRINKLSHKIVLINDDVRKFCESTDIKFDRIVMPIAIGGEDYLDFAFKIVKNNGMIHFYSTGNVNDMFSKAEELIKEIAKKNKRKIKIEKRVKVLPFGVKSYKICIDIKAGVA